jgi:two-component system, OmpR family, response regulator
MANKVFQNEKFDVGILDIMMPKKDGFTLGKQIRDQNKSIPLLYLTARSMREDQIKAYQLGADDYVTKPFDSELLLFKLKAILGRRTFEPQAQQVWQIGTYTFNVKMRSLQNQQAQIIKLSPKEAQLLNLLCQYQNNVLPRDLALKQIWKDDTYFTGRSMDVYIVKLRKYLALDDTVQINNVHGNGFSLVVK